MNTDSDSHHETPQEEHISVNVSDKNLIHAVTKHKSEPVLVHEHIQLDQGQSMNKNTSYPALTQQSCELNISGPTDSTHSVHSEAQSQQFISTDTPVLEVHQPIEHQALNSSYMINHPAKIQKEREMDPCKLLVSYIYGSDICTYIL